MSKFGIKLRYDDEFLIAVYKKVIKDIMQKINAILELIEFLKRLEKSTTYRDEFLLWLEKNSFSINLLKKYLEEVEEVPERKLTFNTIENYSEYISESLDCIEQEVVEKVRSKLIYNAIKDCPSGKTVIILKSQYEFLNRNGDNRYLEDAINTVINGKKKYDGIRLFNSSAYEWVVINKKFADRNTILEILTDWKVNPLKVHTYYR